MTYLAYSAAKSLDVWSALRKGFDAADAGPAQPGHGPRSLNHHVTAILGGLEGDQPALMSEARRHRVPYVFCDAGYMATHINGRRARYRVVPSAYNQHWLVPAGPDRFNALGLRIQPWRRTGREILVCGSSDVQAEFFGLQHWMQQTCWAIRGYTDRPVIRRDKAAARRGELPPFAEALKTAWAVVAWSSSVAVEAALAGVPVFVGPESAALPVNCGRLDEIEFPHYPDNREPWAWSLADAQFTVEEIADGAAYRHECRSRSYSPGWPAALPMTSPAFPSAA